jgi:hypothetical protein
MSMSHLIPERLLDLNPFADLSPDRFDAPHGEVRQIPVTDEMRRRDADELAAREGWRRPPASAVPISEVRMDSYWRGLNVVEKYWLLESAREELRREEARTA